jgi:hypothetical protein
LQGMKSLRLFRTALSSSAMCGFIPALSDHRRSVTEDP